MKNVLFKDFIREIKGNKGRFLSIFFIVLFGAAFFSGIRATGGNMKYSADRYFDKSELMDIRVLSTYGITDADIDDISKISKVEAVIGGYTQEAFAYIGKDEYTVKAIAETDSVNKLTLEQGREIRSKDECVVDEVFLERSGKKIGDKVSLISGTDDPLEDNINQTEFTIVGSGVLPYYLDLNRDVGTIGDGKIDGFIVVSPEIFDLDVYTEAYVKVKGADALNTYSDEYDSLVKPVEDEIKEISSNAKERRYKEVYDDAQSQIEDGQQEVDDAKKELADAKKELDDGEKELADAKSELDDGEKELEDARKELEDGKTQLEESKKEIDDGERQLADAKKEIDDGKTQLADAALQLESSKAVLDENGASLAEARKTLESKEAQLNESSLQVEAGLAQIDAAQQELDVQIEQLDMLKASYTGLSAQYEELKAQLEADPGNEILIQQVAQLEAVLNEMSVQISAAETQINAYQTELNAKRTQLEDAAVQIEAGRMQIEAAKSELEAGEQKYAQGVAAYNEGFLKYKNSLETWEKGKQEYENKLEEFNKGKQEYEDGLKEWEDGRIKYENAVIDYNDGLKEYEDGYKEWEDGSNEYNSSYEEAQEKIADAENELADAKEKLEKLEKPKWYILNRDKIRSVVSFGSDAERMDSLGHVFPVIFFLVAALVSLTAMTRMVEEQRQQIGTLKALGYSSGSIIAKYFAYAILATVTGAVIGVLIGEKALPEVIISSYCIMYKGLPEYFITYDIVQGSLAVIISAACTGFAAAWACIRKIKEKPAELMRPESPKAGKRIFVEKIPFIWKHLNFTHKSTVRNLFRYKKRLIMTVIGIGGCMGLMLVGFGVKDSIADMAMNQYTDIFMQDATITIDEDASKTDIDSLIDEIVQYDGIEEEMELYQQSVTLKSANKEMSASLYVPEDTEEADYFVTLRDRRSKEKYDYPEDTAALSEKTAKELNVKVGDTLSIQKGENTEPVEIVVGKIIENYVLHYAFISPEKYRELFDEDIEFNSIIVKYEDKSEKFEKQFGTQIMKNDACSGISFTVELEKTIDDMLGTLNLVVFVLIVAAALLAFVVLYNLNSINITERRRELATLKVLGCYDMEVAMYVYRENIILTIFGIVIGVIIGTVLHQFTITTVEIDSMMFGRTITFGSYLICAVLTGVFSLIVNLIMYYNFKKINMVESLKSVE